MVIFRPTWNLLIQQLFIGNYYVSHTGSGTGPSVINKMDQVLSQELTF